MGEPSIASARYTNSQEISPFVYIDSSLTVVVAVDGGAAAVRVRVVVFMIVRMVVVVVVMALVLNHQQGAARGRGAEQPVRREGAKEKKSRD
jgi:hypothetical protein